MKRIKKIAQSAVLSLLIVQVARAENNFNIKVSPLLAEIFPVLLTIQTDLSIITNNFSYLANPAISPYTKIIFPQIEFKISENYSITPIIEPLNFDVTVENNQYNLDASNYGASLTYFQNGAFSQGKYFKLSLSNSSVNIKNKTKNETSSIENIAVGLLVGKRWAWENFNINTEIGSSYNFINSSNVDSQGAKTSSGITPLISCCHAELSIGYAF